MQAENIILVNEKDEALGTMEKLEAHEKGALHRAFSIFLFNSRGEMLLQQRALSKYHSAGLWTNACCGHPRAGEETAAAALRRLNEEMGIGTRIEKAFDFIYKAEFDNGLIEHEFDHVFAGEYDGPVNANPEEVNDFCYKNIPAIRDSLMTHPQKYTVWFHLAFQGIEKWWKEHYQHIVF